MPTEQEIKQLNIIYKATREAQVLQPSKDEDHFTNWAYIFLEEALASMITQCFFTVDWHEYVEQ